MFQQLEDQAKIILKNQKKNKINLNNLKSPTIKNKFAWLYRLVTQNLKLINNISIKVILNVNQYIYAESSHSSDMEQFKYLKNIKCYNLNDQNLNKKIGNKKFKIKQSNNNNMITKTQQQSPQINKLRIKSKQEKSTKSQTKNFSYRNIAKKINNVKKTKQKNQEIQNLIGQSTQFKNFTPSTPNYSNKYSKNTQLINKKKIKAASNNNSSQDQQVYTNLTLNFEQKNKKSTVHKNNLLIKTGITLGDWCGEFPKTQSPYPKQFNKK